MATQLDIPHLESSETNPIKRAKLAHKEAKKQFADILIIDTAGRLHIDQEMMDEIQTISKTLPIQETLLVVDSMTGQDAANVAKSFADTLSLGWYYPDQNRMVTPVVAQALSMRMITNKPIKFIGTGEKIDKLDRFRPETSRLKHFRDGRYCLHWLRMPKRKLIKLSQNGLLKK